MADLREVEAWCAKRGHPVPQHPEEEDLMREVQEEVDALLPFEDWIPQDQGEDEEPATPLVPAPSNPAFPPGFPFHNGNPFEQEGFPFRHGDKKGKKQKKAEAGGVSVMNVSIKGNLNVVIGGGGGVSAEGDRNAVISQPAQEGALVPYRHSGSLLRRRVKAVRKMAMSSLIPLCFLGMLTGQSAFLMAALMLVLLAHLLGEGGSK
jgi:hypothetical protein